MTVGGVQFDERGVWRTGGGERFLWGELEAVDLVVGWPRRQAGVIRLAFSSRRDLWIEVSFDVHGRLREPAATELLRLARVAAPQAVFTPEAVGGADGRASAMAGKVSNGAITAQEKLVAAVPHDVAVARELVMLQLSADHPLGEVQARRWMQAHPEDLLLVRAFAGWLARRNRRYEANALLRALSEPLSVAGAVDRVAITTTLALLERPDAAGSGPHRMEKVAVVAALILLVAATGAVGLLVVKQVQSAWRAAEGQEAADATEAKHAPVEGEPTPPRPPLRTIEDKAPPAPLPTHTRPFSKIVELASDGGVPEMVELGQRYLAGQAGAPHDPAEAVRWFQSAVDAGSATGKLWLGLCLLHGRGVERDSARGIELIRWAAEADVRGAHGAMADCLEGGIGVPRDPAAALAWAQRGDAAVPHSTARVLGDFALHGVGMRKDASLARIYFRRGAQHGDPVAMTRYGVMLAFELGGAREPARAVRWWTWAAERGDASAELFLARAYFQGEGVRPNRLKAELHLVKARRAWKELDDAAIDALSGVTPTDAPLEDFPVPKRAADGPPKVRFQAQPMYPLEMRYLGINGEVLVGFIVDARGHVTEMKMLKTTNAHFVAAALEAVGRWRFEPGFKEGRPVNTRMQVPIVFRIDQDHGTRRDETSAAGLQ